MYHVLQQKNSDNFPTEREPQLQYMTILIAQWKICEFFCARIVMENVQTILNYLVLEWILLRRVHVN